MRPHIGGGGPTHSISLEARGVHFTLLITGGQTHRSIEGHQKHKKSKPIKRLTQQLLTGPATSSTSN